MLVVKIFFFMPRKTIHKMKHTTRDHSPWGFMPPLGLFSMRCLCELIFVQYCFELLLSCYASFSFLTEFSSFIPSIIICFKWFFFLLCFVLSFVVCIYSIFSPFFHSGSGDDKQIIFEILKRKEIQLKNLIRYTVTSIVEHIQQKNWTEKHI